VSEGQVGGGRGEGGHGWLVSESRKQEAGHQARETVSASMTWVLVTACGCMHVEATRRCADGHVLIRVAVCRWALRARGVG
jgi:hypothetical protein